MNNKLKKAAGVALFLTVIITNTSLVFGNSISLNKNNRFLSASSADGNVKLATGTIDKHKRVKFKFGAKVPDINSSKDPVVSLNKNNVFIEANHGKSSNTIYYNAGKVDDNGNIEITDKGVTFSNNKGQHMALAINDLNQFIEIHEGSGSKWPWAKNEHKLYFVAGHINSEGKIKITGHGSYNDKGLSPAIAVNKNNFIEAHLSQNTHKIYYTYGILDYNGHIKKDPQGAVKLSDVKYDKIAAIHFKMVNQDPGQGYFEISLFATKKDGETIYENNGAWYDNNVQFHKYVNQLPFEGYYGLSVGSGSANNDYVISLGNFQEGHIAKKEASH